MRGKKPNYNQYLHETVQIYSLMTLSDMMKCYSLRKSTTPFSRIFLSFRKLKCGKLKFTEQR